MEEKISDFEEETTSIVKIEDMTLNETQLAEQLYNSAVANLYITLTHS